MRRYYPGTNFPNLLREIFADVSKHADHSVQEAEELRHALRRPRNATAARRRQRLLPLRRERARFPPYAWLAESGICGVRYP